MFVYFFQRAASILNQIIYYIQHRSIVISSYNLSYFVNCMSNIIYSIDQLLQVLTTSASLLTVCLTLKNLSHLPLYDCVCFIDYNCS